MHCRYSKIGFPHLFCQPVHLSARVAKDYSLRYSERIIKVTEGIKLPFLLFDSDKKLLDSYFRKKIPSKVNSSRFTSTRIGSVMNFFVISKTSTGKVALSSTT